MHVGSAGSQGPHVHPHPAAPLAIRAAPNGRAVVYIEAPERLTAFRLIVTGARAAPELARRGGRVRLVPVNPTPYQASATDRFVYTVRLPAGGARLLRLTVRAGDAPVRVGTLRRLRMFLHRPARRPPAAQVRVSARDASGRRLAVRVSVYRGRAWWTAAYPGPGGARLWLPPGAYTLQAERGLEYRPDRHRVVVAPGDKLAVRFRLHRGLRPRRGWICGDTHVHSTVSDGVATIPELLRMAEACGLDWLAVTDHANRSYDPLLAWGLAQVRACSRHGRVLGLAGEETGCAGPSAHLNAFNIRRPILPEHRAVDPEGRSRWTGRKTVGDVLAEVNAQAAPPWPVLLGYNHPLHQDCEGERVLRACSGLRAMEISTGNHMPAVKARVRALWFRALNQGRRLAGLAGTDTHFADFYPPGSERVYCRVRGRPTAAKVVRALAAGRSFCAWGPALVWLRANGREPGATLRLPGPRAIIDVAAEVEALWPIARVCLVHNGRTVRTWEEGPLRTEPQGWVYPPHSNAAMRLCARDRVTVGVPGWIVVLAHLRGFEGPVAVTNPVYLTRTGSGGREQSRAARR